MIVEKRVLQSWGMIKADFDCPLIFSVNWRKPSKIQNPPDYQFLINKWSLQTLSMSDRFGVVKIHTYMEGSQGPSYNYDASSEEEHISRIFMYLFKALLFNLVNFMCLFSKQYPFSEFLQLPSYMCVTHRPFILLAVT